MLESRKDYDTKTTYSYLLMVCCLLSLWLGGEGVQTRSDEPLTVHSHILCSGNHGTKKEEVANDYWSIL